MERSHSQRRWMLASLGVLALSLVVRLGVAWASFEGWQLSYGPLVDDSFYYFEIARNISLGLGVTQDGMVPTSGFQPLWAALLVPIWAVAGDDPVRPIHLALSVQAVLGVLAGGGILALVRRVAGAGAGCFSVVVWSASPTVLTHTMNGLETPLAACALVWATWLYLERIRSSGGETRDWLALGALLAACFLSRADLAIFVMCLTLDAVHRFGFTELVRRGWKGACVALMLVLPWIAWCCALGSPVPESGGAIRLLSELYSERSVYTTHVYGTLGFYGENVFTLLRRVVAEPLLPQPILPLPYLLHWGLRGGASATWLSLALLVALAVVLHRGVDALRGMPAFLGAWAVLTLAAYAVWVPGQWFYDRYVFGILTLGVVANGVVLGRVIAALPRWAGRAWLVLCVAGCVGVFVRQGEIAFARTDGKNVEGYYLLAKVLHEADFPEPLGVPQAGVVGYFCECEFVALDGKVNGEVAQHLRSATVDTLLRKERVGAVVDHYPWMVDLVMERTDAPVPVGERHRLREGKRVLGDIVVFDWP